MPPSITGQITGSRLGGLCRAAVLAATVLLAGCVNGNPAGGEQSQAAEPPQPPKQYIVEPRGQRSPFGNYLVGRHAERQRDFDKASEALSRALENNPNDLGLLRRAFFLALEAGQVDRAIQLGHKLDDAGLTFSTVQLLLTAESVKNKDYPAALSRLNSMKREDLGRYTVPLAQAWAHAGAGQTDRALSALSVLGEDKATSLLHHLHAGFINDLANRVDAAGSAYGDAAGGKPETAPNRVIRAYGNFLERHERGAEARSLYEGYAGQEADNLLFDEALARIADGRKPDRLISDAAAGLAESFFDIASILPMDRAGEFVLIYVRMAIYLQPDFPLAQLLMGDAFDEFGRYEEAAEIYRSIDSDSAYGWVARLRLADDLFDMGRKDDSIALLKVMSEERPERSDALIRLGNTYRYEERYDEAIDAYDRAEKRIGEITIANWTLLYSRGIALERVKNWDRAEADFLKALELQPDQPFVLNYLGYSWVELGKNLERAKGMLQRAVDQRPDDGYIVDSMGWALYKLGDYAGAVENLERAVALRPQDPVINDHLGDAYWRVGRFGEARIQWRRSLGLEPEEDLIQQIEEKLENGLGPAAKPAGGG